MKVKKDKRSVLYGLGARFLVEMERWMKLTFEDEIWECGICRKIGMIGKTFLCTIPCLILELIPGVECTKRNCELKFHKYCVDNGRKDPRCNRCKSAIKVGGVATKRH